MIKFISKTSGKLLNILQAETNLSYNLLSKKLNDKQVLVDNVRVKTNDNIEKGTEIVIFAAEKSFKIIFEDENVIVVIKPMGILSCPDNNDNNSVQEIISKKQKVYAVHRLDVNTEGILMFAKSNEVLEELIKIFENKDVEKSYITNIFGKPKFKEITAKKFLLKDEKNSIVKVYDNKVNGSSETLTKIKFLSANGETSKLQVTISQGKTHQIRAVLASIGLPIIGDDKYGNGELNKKYKTFKQQLFATQIKFNTTGKFAYLNNINLSYEPDLKF